MQVHGGIGIKNQLLLLAFLSLINARDIFQDCFNYRPSKCEVQNFLDKRTRKFYNPALFDGNRKINKSKQFIFYFNFQLFPFTAVFEGFDAMLK